MRCALIAGEVRHGQDCSFRVGLLAAGRHLHMLDSARSCHCLIQATQPSFVSQGSYACSMQVDSSEKAWIFVEFACQPCCSRAFCDLKPADPR